MIAVLAGLSHQDARAQAVGEVAVFEPGLISTDLGERDASFHPNGRELYFTLWTGRFGVIMVSHMRDGEWGEPETAPFSGHFSDLEPFVTPDGSRLLFASTRPLFEGDESGDFNLWSVVRDGDGWGDPTPIAEINTDANEFYPSVDRTGTLYWTAAYESSMGGEDIFFAIPTDTGFSAPRNVGPGVNSARDEFNALIAPDGSWLAFGSFGREDGHGGGDLYISFRSDADTFGTAINMGSEINSSELDFCPSLSVDGRTFYFSSRRTTLPSMSSEKRTYRGLAAALRAPGNGQSDLYSVDAAIIEALRAKATN